MSRIAHCSCGSLRVETTGEPTHVVACHCLECQRRTGAPFGVGVYFEKAQVRAEGASKVYIRDGQKCRMPGSISVQNAAPRSIGTRIGYPTILSSLLVHSPILLSPRRRDRSGRNRGIRKRSERRTGVRY